MTRRILLVTLAGGILVALLAAEAQQAGKVYRVGVLASSTEANFGPSVKVFREALHAAGWVEGRNLTLDVRYSEQYARLPELATEFVGLKVDVLASLGTPATLAAKRATIREVLPRADRIAVLANRANPVTTLATRRRRRH